MLLEITDVTPIDAAWRQYKPADQCRIETVHVRCGRIEILPVGPDCVTAHKLLIDGYEMRGVLSLSLDMAAGEVPRLVLTMDTLPC